MPDFQVRQEETDIDFLVRNRFDGCVSSCSSALGGADADGDDLAEYGSPDRRPSRVWRSSVDGDDVAESSAAVRRQSQILSNWVARHAEMITNIERRNRESELMALAGLHTVSTLDSSFLRESRRSPSSVDRPVASRASTILQMWRQLEDMSGARERRSGTDRTTSESRVASESVDNGYGQWDGEPLRTGNREANLQDGADGSSSREQSPDLGDAERERVRQIVRGWMVEERARESSAQELSPRNGSPRSEWLGETERERVRLVREWVQMASQQRDIRESRMEEADRNQDRNGSSIGHQVDHAGRTSLRIRGRQAHLDLVTRMARERQRELQGLSEARAVSGFPYRSRIQSLLRGRFLRNGRGVEDERSASVTARELGQLGRRNSVTGLREGFRFRLENTASGQHSSLVENSSSLNVQNRTDQSHMSNSVDLSSDHESVSRNEASDDRQGIDTLTQLESDRSSDEMDWQESANQTEIWQEDVLPLGRQEWQQSTEGGLNEWHDGAEEESNGNWLQSSEQGWYHRTPEDGVDHHLPEVDDWHDNDSQVTVDNWLDGLSTLPPPPPPPPPPPQSQYGNASSRVSGFIPSDDDNMYSVEIRELLNRRSVSNLLRSGFRESLDRLIRSYVERQVHSPLDWAVQQNSPSPDSIEEELDQQRDNSIEDQHDSVVRPASTMQSPPVPPRQPLWQSVMHHNNWSRQTMHHTDIEWNVISDLRAELSRLQQGMSNMQRMLEACMDMQLELQRSVRQEVSAALNRSLGKGMCEEWSDDGSKWTNVKNGTCCVCCDGHIDSLLYRCGHMCTCSKCANELVRSGGKCPLCRAPIIEVIRAYSIL